MEDNNLDLPKEIPARNWSNRILAASLFGILFFTMFPYWMDLSRQPAGHRSPFLLGRALQFDGFLHTSLNTLLFLPFGFALSTFFKEPRKSWIKSLALAVVTGLVFSYTIEFVQIYIPTRDSAWDDVIANTLGSFLGMILGLISSKFILRKLSKWEKQVELWLSLKGIVAVGLVYFVLWLAFSIPLQQKAAPANWSPSSYLSVGNDIRGNLPWNGKVLRLQIWDKALSADQMMALSENVQNGAAVNSGLLAAYDISHAPPIANQAGSLPSIVSTAFSPISPEPFKLPHTSRGSWLRSETPVPELAEAVRGSNQFAVQLACVPRDGTETDGALVAISDLAGETDFIFKQEGTGLEIIFRNKLASRKSFLSWAVKDVFIANTARVISFSYDGAKGSLYIDGKKERSSFLFSPGAALVQKLVRIKTNELVAYSVLYDSVIFLPIGFLLGIAARKVSHGNRMWIPGLVLAVLVPSLALEVLLAWVSGRPVSLGQLVLTLSLTVSGFLWVNLDSPASV
jgi:glycopeptide antibiotics resistance protein